jgi:prepilin-type N-terminal cleavage/methylation domain-containing protein
MFLARHRNLSAFDRRRKARAFTLFELSLCLLIIGIIAAALVPIIGNNIRSSRLRTAANVLAADIDYCSSICISKPKSPAAVSFNTSQNKYTLIDVNTGATLKHPADSADFVNDFATGRNSQYADVVLKSAVAGTDVAALTFDSYGKPVLSADLVITLTYNMQTLTVTVKAGTGDVSISG